jgi:hypothetical protein
VEWRRVNELMQRARKPKADLEARAVKLSSELRQLEGVMGMGIMSRNAIAAAAKERSAPKVIDANVPALRIAE